MTKIGIVVGSIRENSQSSRISEYAQSRLMEIDPTVEVEIFSLKDLEIPLWSEDKWSPRSDMSKDWAAVSRRLKSCDGFTVVVPEWAGMAPPHLKNFLLMCDKGELAHKPATLVSISSGMGGAYPIAELRMSGYKNNFIMWLPDHLILRNVADLFVSDAPTELDISVTARIDYSLTYLVQTSIALKPVIAEYQDIKTYKFGM
jgi:azobenzene reductase